MSNSYAGGFSRIEAFVLVLTVMVGVSLMAVAAERHDTANQRMENRRQLREIHQGLVIFAQGNRSRFPGYPRAGEPIDLSPEARFQVLLEGEFTEPKLLVSSLELLESWAAEQDMTHEHYSYAMLHLEGAGRDKPRNGEWAETLNTQAAVLSDRNTGPRAGEEAADGKTTDASLWSTPEQPGWRGAVAWNDNHVSFEVSPELDETIYGHGERQQNDHLFESDGDEDALMTFSRDGDDQERRVPRRGPAPEADVDE